MKPAEVPLPLTSDGVNLATLDAVIAILRTLIGSNPTTGKAVCQLLRERVSAYQRVADEDGNKANINAAATLRLIMGQAGCADIPDQK